MTDVLTIRQPDEMREWSDRRRRHGERLGLVPTMGALHAGHLDLIRFAQEQSDRVVVSIFVNPLQFDERSDFDAYPRPIDDDVEQCHRLDVDVVYAPTAASMYPAGFDTRVAPGELALHMEGAARPGHFEGVTTVVAKLFGAVRPDVAVFGEKDFQQLAVIRRMATDLDMGIDIIGHAVVREPDGLALSSRNRRLDEAHRRAAICVPNALCAAATRATEPGASVGEVVAAARAVIESEPLADLDYITVFDSSTLQPVDAATLASPSLGSVRIAAAARFGDVRLIDNRELFPR